MPPVPEPPAVSLVTTVYNVAAFIKEAAVSVLSQRFTDFEWIVYDDGSTDGSAATLLEAAGGDPRVRLIRGDTNTGPGPALHAATALATAPLIGWLDADDRLHPDALKLTRAYLHERPHIGLVYTHHRLIDAAGRVGPPPQRQRIPYSRQRLLTDFMTFHFRLYRQEVAASVGGVPGDLPAANDYDFCLRMSEACEIRCLPRPLYDYRVHRGSVSGTRRLEQIQSSAEAIRRALARRSMPETLHVEYNARFRLT